MLLFQLAILCLSIVCSVVLTDYFKYRLGNQLAAAFRNDLLMGDTRKAMLELPATIRGDFTGVKWDPSGSSQAFSIPENINLSATLIYRQSVVSIYFDEDRIKKSGDLVFYYNRWTPIVWALSVWALLFLGSIPVWLREKKKIIQEYALTLKAEINESRANLAAQVAHDIRSPLAALGAATKGLDLPDDQRTLIDGAVGRMQGIADDLLARYRTPGEAVKARPETCALAGLIDQVLAEKRLQHKDKAGVRIDFEYTAPGARAAVDPKELQRLISNLVNNAVEAFEKAGTVFVGLAATDGRVLITVKDDGKGIPPAVLAKLGQKGETHGKAGGTGLGLYHARTSAESWGGSLKIESEPGRGTTITITLPAAAKPAAGLKAALLDDDPLVHMNWKLAARATGAELKSFKTPQEFLAAAETLPRDIPLYIDSELGEGVKGEDTAVELHDKGFTDISMATGHNPGKFSHLPWLKVTGKEPPWA